MLTWLLFSVAQEAPTRWQALCAERWGPLTELHFAAAGLAGSWKALYKSKHETDRKSEQVQNLCPFELRAAIQRMEACCAPPGQSTVVTFCLDGSGSMASEDFKVMTSFVATAMEAILEAKHNCKVGRSSLAHALKRAQFGTCPSSNVPICYECQV